MLSLNFLENNLWSYIHSDTACLRSHPLFPSAFDTCFSSFHIRVHAKLMQAYGEPMRALPAMVRIAIHCKINLWSSALLSLVHGFAAPKPAWCGLYVGLARPCSSSRWVFLSSSLQLWPSHRPFGTVLLLPHPQYYAKTSLGIELFFQMPTSCQDPIIDVCLQPCASCFWNSSQVCAFSFPLAAHCPPGRLRVNLSWIIHLFGTGEVLRWGHVFNTRGTSAELFGR